MIKWMYKWLPIIFGCHCREDRSFYYKNKRFPICARCTGELVGIMASVFSCFFFQVSFWGATCLLVPMIIDGLVQNCLGHESNNKRRFVTGVLFGYGFWMLFIITSMQAFEYGKSLVH